MPDNPNVRLPKPEEIQKATRYIFAPFDTDEDNYFDLTSLEALELYYFFLGAGYISPDYTLVNDLVKGLREWLISKEIINV